MTPSSRQLMRFALIAFVLLLAGCASVPQVTTDTDPSADFSRYRTFAFHDPLAVESRGYTTPASSIMRAAAKREMEARGYVFDLAAPDLLVNINATLEEKIDVYPSYWGYGGYYGYRGGYYWGAPYFWDDNTYEYTEGTLNIDLVDAHQKRLVWEGVAVGRISRMQAAERAQRINGTMAEIFAHYPHQAGSAGGNPAVAY